VTEEPVDSIGELQLAETSEEEESDSDEEDPAPQDAGDILKIGDQKWQKNQGWTIDPTSPNGR